ncbi:hypothetical protein BU24DRAFT_427787 [Aaosphaeria arxii CBS 175.79]|uniref:Zn(2)-C6 fungal-type domain-containing protein n=1 Tax=Aaosphaeria arxii CBS 175.79 TaxID=1450172 RepID=A0A6A5XCZ2_9PLEO|nr:uncharacterized protein BU24DRAFT_427787 [Aaosphaeria arxii CBS 175.79]KAF2010676.1 hypothetical protein BU24DRAFT_427787 [Aaosphaeria arxii CBS 175.79]
MTTDPIDPRLHYPSSLPPRTLPQSYPTNSAALQSAATAAQQPYYNLPTSAHPPPPQLSHSSPSNLDPALGQTSPTVNDGTPDNHDDGGHNIERDGSHDEHPVGISSTDMKRPRACDSCRGLKVRCDQERPDRSCRRCAKANRPCITTPPTRKRQKKADSRVAELERKIDALTATLHAQKTGVPDGPPSISYIGNLPQPEDHSSTFETREAQYRFGSINHDWSSGAVGQYPDPPPGYGPAQTAQRGPEPKRRKLDDDRNNHATIPEDMDAIHRDLAEHPEMKRTNKKGIQADHSYISNLIDTLVRPDVAERIFYRYVNEICPHFPAVPMAPGTTAREIREKKPVLFLAILAGSSHGSAEQLVSQDVQRELMQMLKDQLADIIWRNGEKSLEIVQALQLGVLWYRPPLHYEQHNFYMMVNCAAVMALDLGLGRQPTPNVMKLPVGPFRRCNPNAASIESRRTFLVCYYLCMSITMVLRRPILLRWTKYMDESVKMLETSPDALPSDKLLVQHVKMAHIGEDISVSFSMDDPSAEVSISEPKVIYALRRFEADLKQLRDENAQFLDVDPALRLAEHVTNLYIHEIALHHNQSPADFQPPFPSETLQSAVGKDAIGPAHISALGECLTATHGILDTILSVPLEILLTLPVIFCVRAIYAIVCLMKMWVSVNSPGEVGFIIKQEHLGIESYTERLVAMFNAIVIRDAQSPHGKFFFVAKRLQERFAQIKEGTSRTEAENRDDSRRAAAKTEANSHPKQDSTNQTPLHLLSEVAMGSGNPPVAQSQQAAGPPNQPQAQQLPPGWYDVGLTQQSGAMEIPQSGFDSSFDIAQFDFGMGSDADLSALFIPDAALWNFGTVQTGTYTGASF